MKPPYSIYDIQAVDRFSGETDSARILQIAHCVMLLKQGVEKGFGVFRQRKILSQTLCGESTDLPTIKWVRENVALSSYIILDKHIIEVMNRQREWSAGALARYIENRFENIDSIKKFYGRSHRL